MDNKIGPAGAKVVAEVLKDNKTLTSLNLRILAPNSLEGNDIGNEGVKEIVESLKSHPTVTTLILSKF